jgi:hypothetical protein
VLGKAAAFKINDWLIAPTASSVGFNVAAEEVVVRGDLIALVETADSQRFLGREDCAGVRASHSTLNFAWIRAKNSPVFVEANCEIKGIQTWIGGYLMTNEIERPWLKSVTGPEHHKKLSINAA